MEEEYENLYFAVCQRAVEDYKNNLKIIEHTQSDIVREKAQKDNNQIEKFLGEKIIGMIHSKLVNERKKIEIQTRKRNKVVGIYSSEKDRAKAYYQINKDAIKEESRLKRQKRKELGLCTCCGKNKPMQGSNWCDTCREKRRRR